MHTIFTRESTGCRTSRPAPTSVHRRNLALRLASCLLLAGCGTQPRPVNQTIPLSPNSGSTGSADSGQNPTKSVASLGKTPLDWSDLGPELAELAGAQALHDAALDAGLDAELQARGLVLPPQAIDQERTRLMATIAADSGLGTAQADQALHRIRASRGLGPVRFAQLLARNAKLRLLASGSVSISPDELQQEAELQLGAKVSAILVLVSTEREASMLRAGLLESPGPSAERLAELARARSLDSSASSGGRIGPIHPRDPRVPASLRSVFESLTVGETSPVIATDSGFALVMIESRSEPTPRTPERMEQVERSLFAKKERLAMEALAQRLANGASVRAMNPSLKWSWDQAKENAER